MQGIAGRLADFTFWTLPFDIAYTEQKSGADLPKLVGTSGFLNALVETTKFVYIRTKKMTSKALKPTQVTLLQNSVL